MKIKTIVTLYYTGYSILLSLVAMMFGYGLVWDSMLNGASAFGSIKLSLFLSCLLTMFFNNLLIIALSSYLRKVEKDDKKKK